ncbi:MAG: DUF1211 domain-containing protein [Deltaproteobacteria bacterium]|nr:DUF1211 domain-containing protein [Deltaproteobacteria bacterium]
MTRGRLEAFSDGVIAILITIMVLELKVPHGDELSALEPLWPVFLSYVLSFIYLGIYWNNHHHMMHLTPTITGGVLWANLHLLFWLSLIPFTTGWVGENHFGALPMAIYGVNLFMAGIAYVILQSIIIRHQGPDSRLRRAVGADRKGKISAVAYLSAIALTLVTPVASGLIYVAVALMWLVPDRRIETQLHRDEHAAD